MKAFPVILLLMAGTAFVMLGCSESSGPGAAPTSTIVNAAPPLMKTSGSGGAWIERYESNRFYWWFVDENGLLVTLGIKDLGQYCAGSPSAKELLDYKLIYLPNADPDLRRIVSKIEYQIESEWMTGISTSTYSWSGKGFLAVPSLIVLSNLKPVNPYGKFGLVLGFLKSTQEVSAKAITGTWQYRYEETGGLSIGFAGALGVIVPAGGAVDFFAEVVLHSVTYSPRKSETTKYAVDGRDWLSTINPPTLDFKDSYTSNEQNVTPGVRRPFSSIGFSAGVRVAL